MPYINSEASIKSRKYKRNIGQLQKYITRLNNDGYHCASVYSTTNGLLKVFGHTSLRDKLTEAAIGVLGEMSNTPNADRTDPDIAREASIAIPLLQRTISEMSVMDFRSTIPQLMKTVNDGHSGWGKLNKQPILWWPSDVPFQNPRKRPTGFQGIYNINIYMLSLCSCMFD